MTGKINTPEIIKISEGDNGGHIQKSISTKIALGKAEVIISGTMQKIQFIFPQKNIFTHMHPANSILEPNDYTVKWYNDLYSVLKTIKNSEQKKTYEITEEYSQLDRIISFPFVFFVKMMTFGNKWKIFGYKNVIYQTENMLVFFNKILGDIEARIDKYSLLNDDDYKDNIINVLSDIKYDLDLLIKALNNRVDCLKKIISIIESA